MKKTSENENKPKKDSLTGTKIVNYEFLKIDFNPPSKLKRKKTDSFEIARMFRDIDYLVSGYEYWGDGWFFEPSKKKSKKGGGSESSSLFSFLNFSSATTKRYSYNKENGKKQRCTVKMFYGNKVEDQKKFLRNYMPQNNKKDVIDKPELFNEDVDSMTENDLLKYETVMDDRFFKFIISPENQKVPMKEFVRAYVHKLEALTGHRFSWCAVVHTNTEHVHAHLLINGVDAKTRKQFKFEKDVVKQSARELAMNICTDLCGPRTEEEIAAAKNRLPESYRWTVLDDRIAKNPSFTSFEPPKNIGGEEFAGAVRIDALDNIERKRLATLVQIGLARKIISGYYHFEKDWEKKLRSIGRYNTFIEARNSLRYTSGSRLEQYSKDSGEIRGIITQRYIMDDEKVWNNAVVVENKVLGKAWYIPLSMKPDEKLVGHSVIVNLQKSQTGKLRPNISITS